MANFPQYLRSVSPQGQLAPPQGPTPGEALGAGLQDLGAGGEDAAIRIARANASAKAQQNAVEHQTAIKGVLDFSNTQDQAYRDAEKAAPPGAAGFSDTVLQNFDKAVAEKRAAIPASQGEYFDEQMMQARGALAGQAATFQDKSRLNYINTQSDEIVGAGAAQLVTSPEKLGFVQKNVLASFASMDASPEEKAQLAKAANVQLQTAALGGLIDKDAPSALKQMQSGAWDGVGAPKLAQYIGQAQQQIKADDAQRKAEARAAEVEAKANFNIVFDDAVSTAANTGVQKTVSEGDIDKHYSGAAAVVLKRQLATAQAEGVARITTSGTTYDEDQAWIDAHKPKTGAEFTGDQAKVYQAGTAAIDAKRKALASEVAQDLKDSADQNKQVVASKADDWTQQAISSGRIPDEASPAISEAFAGDAVGRDKAMSALQQAVDLGNQSRGAVTGSADQNAATLDALDQEGKSSAAAAVEADAVRKVIVAKQTAYTSNDPAGAALTYSPSVQAYWSAWQQHPEDTGALRQAIAMTQTEMDRQKVPRDKQQPLPASVATSIVGQIMSQPAPKDQLNALLQYADFGDAKTTNAVLGQLTALKGGLPDGTDLVIDIAQSDKARAERVWTTMRADTKGVELPKEGKDAITNGLNGGLLAVLKGQSEATGNSDAAAALAGPVLNAAAQYAKAKVMVGGDPAAAGTQAVQDLTGQYALISDPSLAQVYYPKQLETAAPGAMEAGLTALRTDAAQAMKPGAGLTGDVANVVAKFPAMANIASNVVVEDKPGDVAKQGYLESYPPWEEYNPHPGKFTSQVFDASAKGDTRTSLIAGDMLHYIGAINPDTGQAVDPTYRAMKERLTATMTPQQTAANRANYEGNKAKDKNDTRTFEQFMDTSRGDEFIMGYITPDKNNEWAKVYTPEQKQILDGMKTYLQTPTKNPYADATIRDIDSSAVWVNNGQGFALIVPGSTRALSFATYEQARDRGLKSPLPPKALSSGLPGQAALGGSYSIDPLGTMKPKGGQ